MEMACDCSTCENSDHKVEALAVTRSQKLKSPLDWQEQKEIRQESLDQIKKMQKKK